MCKNCADKSTAKGILSALLLSAIVEQAAETESSKALSDVLNETEDPKTVAVVVVIRQNGDVMVSRKGDTTKEFVRQALKPLGKRTYWEEVESEEEVSVTTAI